MYTHVDAVYKNSAAKKAAKHVLLFIAHRTNRDDVARLYHGEIMRSADVSRSTVIRAIKRLSDLGEIEIVEPGHGRSNKSTYRFLLLKDVTMTPIEEIKGTTMTPFSENGTIKGVMVTKKGVTLKELESIKEKDIYLLEPEKQKDDDPILELGNEFSARTGIFPNHHSWNDSWEPVLSYMLQESGDLCKAVNVLEVALEKHGDARTRDGRPYALSSPKSIQSFARQAMTETNEMSDGPEQWDILCKTIFNWGKRAKGKLDPATYAAYKPLAYAWNTMSQEQLDGKIRQQFLDNLRSERDAAAS